MKESKLVPRRRWNKATLHKGFTKCTQTQVCLPLNIMKNSSALKLQLLLKNPTCWAQRGHCSSSALSVVQTLWPLTPESQSGWVERESLHKRVDLGYISTKINCFYRNTDQKVWPQIQQLRHHRYATNIAAWRSAVLFLPSGWVAMTTGAEASLKGPAPALVMQPTLNT